MKLRTIVETIIQEADEQAEIDAMSSAMGSAFKELGAEFESNEDEIKSDVATVKAEVTEAVGAIAIIGMILAAPKVVELFVKGLSKIVATFKKIFKKDSVKTEEEQAALAGKIIEFTHKWHKSYIKGLKWILKVSGIFNKAGIKDDTTQLKAAEAVYYTIIAALAVYSGIGAVSAFKAAAQGAAHGGGFSLAALEAAMASIKTTEVAEFTKKLGLV